jgi:hypothetical protein
MLTRAKRRVAFQVISRAMHANSRQTDRHAYLRAILLAGFAPNALVGWWWAHPIAALGLVPFIAKEGVEALRGETCNDRSPRTEIFSIFNFTNFANPSSTLNNALGVGANLLQPGQPFTQAAAGTTFGLLRQTVERTVGLGTNRQIQFALRLNF